MATARQGMRNLTSVAGLRSAATYPVELLFRKVRHSRGKAGAPPPPPSTADGSMS